MPPKSGRAIPECLASIEATFFAFLDQLHRARLLPPKNRWGGQGLSVWWLALLVRLGRGIALVDQLEVHKIESSGTGVDFPVVDALVVLAPCPGLAGDMPVMLVQGPPAIGTLESLIEPDAQS